jgi:hypothetical protein
MRTLLLLTVLPLPALAQEQPGLPLNPPPPAAVEAAAYVYAAANVCGFRIEPAAFDRLLRGRGSSAADLQLQGPFGGRIRTRFVILSNGMAGARETACSTVWRELGREGSVEAGVVQEGP